MFAKVLGGFVLALAGLTTPVAALAEPLDRTTTFKFDRPVALPGVTLPAGEYRFRLVDPTTSRAMVQVSSADGRIPYAMIATRPSEIREEPAPEPRVRFMETAAGMPSAVKAWWYPGERIGFEFVYPKEQARPLAQGAPAAEVAGRSVAFPFWAMPADVSVRQ
jgi:hypothetical protein